MTDFDSGEFRKVLGHYPTGVCAITGIQPDGEPAAMIVGSFTSVSLDPPLVAFFPDRSSSSWAKLAQCDGFCVNVLSAAQADVCQALASRDPRKFDAVAHGHSPRGAPLFDAAVAWVDCSTHSVIEAGDHFIVLGAVEGFGLLGGSGPLLFHKGGYCEIAGSITG